MRSKTSLFIYFLIVASIFAYLIRGVLTPFVLAAVVAYALNPIVALIERRLRIGRGLAIALLSIVLIGGLVYIIAWFGGKLTQEVQDLSLETRDLKQIEEDAISRIPEWEVSGQQIRLQSIARGALEGLNFGAAQLQGSLFSIFTSAVSRILQVLVFLVATYYFLKDGPKLVAMLRDRFSKQHRKDIDELYQKINQVLGGYLRGQLLLIIIIGGSSSLALLILGVPYALVIGTITGFLELIPLIGPITATVIAATVALLAGSNNFGLDPISISLVVILVYFSIQQVENYFIVPQLMGRLTKIHPLMVIFSVLAGGALAGPVGFILGVPVAASGKILLEYFWDHTSD
jgi:predicted PurR-regulated permease PerM